MERLISHTFTDPTGPDPSKSTSWSLLFFSSFASHLSSFHHTTNPSTWASTFWSLLAEFRSTFYASNGKTSQNPMKKHRKVSRNFANFYSIQYSSTKKCRKNSFYSLINKFKNLSKCFDKKSTWTIKIISLNTKFYLKIMMNQHFKLDRLALVK